MSNNKKKKSNRKQSGKVNTKTVAGKDAKGMTKGNMLSVILLFYCALIGATVFLANAKGLLGHYVMYPVVCAPFLLIATYAVYLLVMFLRKGKQKNDRMGVYYAVAAVLPVFCAVVVIYAIPYMKDLIGETETLCTEFYDFNEGGVIVYEDDILYFYMEEKEKNLLDANLPLTNPNKIRMLPDSEIYARKTSLRVEYYPHTEIVKHAEYVDEE